MYRRIPVQEPTPRTQRFTRRVVKKVQVIDPEPVFDHEEEQEFVAPTGRTKTRQMEAAGGGGGGPVGAGAGGQYEAPYGFLAVRKFKPYVPPSPPTRQRPFVLVSIW